MPASSTASVRDGPGSSQALTGPVWTVPGGASARMEGTRPGEAAQARPDGALRDTRASIMSEWGRVAEDGTVYVKTADGEREVGSWQAGTPEEGLAHFARRFEVLSTEVALLEQRLRSGAGDPQQVAQIATRAQEHDPDGRGRRRPRRARAPRRRAAREDRRGGRGRQGQEGRGARPRRRGQGRARRRGRAAGRQLGVEGQPASACAPSATTGSACPTSTARPRTSCGSASPPPASASPSGAPSTSPPSRSSAASRRSARRSSSRRPSRSRAPPSGGRRPAATSS